MRSTLLLIVFTLSFVANADAAIITVANAIASSNDGGSAMASVNGAGLGAPYPSFPTTHTGANVDGWIGHGTLTDPDPWIHYDFGSIEMLGSMRFWNYNATSLQTRNVRDIDIFFSNTAAAFGDDSHGTWTLLNSLTDMQRGATSNGGTVTTPFGTEYDLTDVSARYIRFDIVSTYGGQPAFGEVQFLEAVAVPEPATFSFLACGVAFSAIRRRR